MPAILQRARARHSYEEFFEARISNPHTRRAYKLTVGRFLDWCDRQGAERRRRPDQNTSLFLRLGAW